jgi:hypothetical protein
VKEGSRSNTDRTVYTVPSLATELGASSTPAREALLELSRGGFLMPHAQSWLSRQTDDLVRVPLVRLKRWASTQGRRRAFTRGLRSSSTGTGSAMTRGGGVCRWNTWRLLLAHGERKFGSSAFRRLAASQTDIEGRLWSSQYGRDEWPHEKQDDRPGAAHQPP